jgi:hypothetical protein
MPAPGINIPDKVRRAAQRLGVDLSSVEIARGVVRVRFNTLIDTKAMGSDIATLIDFARQQGASTAVLDTGLIQHPVLSDWLADPERVRSMLGRPAQVRVILETELPFPVQRRGQIVSTTSRYRQVEITVSLE